MSRLSHIAADGQARMVDVGDKQSSSRRARAQAMVRMRAETLALIREGGHKKGDVIAVARIAGMQAAKKTADLIPLCHPLMLSHVDVTIELDEAGSCAIIETECRLEGRTGVEMEALTAASVAALTIYDMCKAVDKDMVIESVCLQEKAGGKSGHYQRESGQ